MSGQVPAHLVAQVDQYRAFIAELAGLARAHAAEDPCGYPQVCPGQAVADRFDQLSPPRRALLECLMVAELAHLGYGQRAPAPAAEPVKPAAESRPVESPAERRWWWPWRN